MEINRKQYSVYGESTLKVRVIYECIQVQVLSTSCYEYIKLCTRVQPDCYIINPWLSPYH